MSETKRWIGVDVPKDAANTLKMVLREDRVLYEPSEMGREKTHFEILASDDGVKLLLQKAGLTIT